MSNTDTGDAAPAPSEAGSEEMSNSYRYYALGTIHKLCKFRSYLTHGERPAPYPDENRISLMIE